MKFIKKLRYVPKHFAVIGALLIAGAATFATQAWGPTRQTFTVEKPADYVTFNSITNNPTYGDERNFVMVKDASNTGTGGWADNVAVESGKEYLVRVYVHNNAADNLNLVATNTHVTAALGTNTGKNVAVTGYVSADNATPKEIWDDAAFTSTQNFNVAYVPGSAIIYNNATGQAGRSVSDAIVNGSGAVIGYSANDGKVPGCFQYSGYVVFKVKPQFQQTADFTVVKDVRKSGTGAYGQTAQVAPGDKVDYRIAFKNTGNATLENVVIKDQLPAGITYVAGTAKMQNANYQFPNMYSLDENLFNGGSNIGAYTAGANAYVTFTAQVAANANLAVCGINTLKNVATVVTDFGQTSDDAVVTTSKECAPQDIQVCRLSDKTIVTIKDSDFDASKYSKNLADCRDIQVCRLSDKKIVTIKESEFNSSKYSKNLSDCEVQVCRLSDKAIVKIKEQDFDSSKYSRDLNDCNPPVQPGEIRVCRLSDKTVIVIKDTEFDSTKHSKTLNDCVNPVPTPPATIASTGPETVLSGLFGSSALGYGAYSYMASRRAAKNAR